jgi:hypothetical protein
MLTINENQIADRSRNESNAVDTHERENESPNLIKAVIKTAGDRNHRNGYSLDILANFFRNNYESAKFVKCNKEDKRLQINEIFESVAHSEFENPSFADEDKPMECMKKEFEKLTNNKK